jgi:hypothetical protein
MFKVVGKGARRRQTAHTGAADDSLPADRCGLHQSLLLTFLFIRQRRFTPAQPNRDVKQFTPRTSPFCSILFHRNI